MGYEIRLSFDKWTEFLNFMSDLHNREIKEGMHIMNEDKDNFRFENLDEADEDIEELMQQYPIAFCDTTDEDEIRKIHEITEKMAKRPVGAIKPATVITTTFILNRIKNTFASDKIFLALLLTIAALFKIKCGDKFSDGKKRLWQDKLDLGLFLLTEYGFNRRGIENALEILDEYNLIDINKDYQEDKNNPHMTYRATDELYNMLLADEIAF